MDLPKYDGNIFPDEWINIIQKYYYFWKSRYNLQTLEYIDFVKSLVDPTITLPTGIDSFEKLLNALKEDISFTVFKNTNKKKLHLLKYNSEIQGGDTSKFISTFRKLCYNAEINDIEEQKKYLYKSLSMNQYFSNEFYEKVKNVNSTNELIREFENIATEESMILIKSGSIVFVGSSKPDPNSLWLIHFIKEVATYDDIPIQLHHIKSDRALQLKSYSEGGNLITYYKSPSTNYTEVSCDIYSSEWKFNNSKLENYQGYLKSNDIINLSFKKSKEFEFLRSHDHQFTIGEDAFQEVICHNEKLGENDEWCIEIY